ncbi:MAG TPA: AAA-like domain-containing protein, partial [Roseiflexaceae bacterium]|nr:AAA-like domain-containing protein [Roseiflexaceae bacterium]
TQPYNPFTCSNALRLDHPLFRGRAAELVRLERACLDDRYGRFMLVYGGRQNGKTTLLLRLEERLRRHADGGMRICRVDFQGFPRATSQDAYCLLARKVVQVLPQVKSPPDTLDAPALGDFLESILADTSVRRLALLLDELGSLPNATRVDLAHVLRALHTRQRDSAPLSKLQVVLFGGVELYDLALVEVSALHNVCETLPLTDLSEAEAVALIADGLGLADLEGEQAVALGRAVYTRVAGHPYLTQRLGELLAERVLAGERADEAVADALAWELVEQRDPLLEHLRRALVELHLEEAAHRLLSACERTTRTTEATQRLELLGLARRAGRHWMPRCPLLAVALAEWLGVPVSLTAKVPDAAATVQHTAAVSYLRDLHAEQAAVTARILTAPTVEEELRLQRRARELTGEIACVEEMQQIRAATVTSPASPPTPTVVFSSAALTSVSVTQQMGGQAQFHQAVALNLGTVIYGRTPSDDERERLRWYLEGLSAKLQVLPLRGLSQHLHQGEGIAMPQVYTALATEHRIVLAQGTATQLAPFFQAQPF